MNRKVMTEWLTRHAVVVLFAISHALELDFGDHRVMQIVLSLMRAWTEADPSAMYAISLWVIVDIVWWTLHGGWNEPQ